jgi:arginase
LVLGGDHSIGLGSLHGTLNAYENNNKENVGLIWIDAHSDINTPLTTASGNFHGQPLSLLIKEMNENGDIPKLNEFNWIKSYISANNIVFIGLRDIDQDEVYTLKKYNIKAYSMSDIEEYGLNKIMNDTFNYLNKTTRLHVSVDIDSLDPFYAPSTGTPVLGGLTLQQLMFIGNRINLNGKLKTLDLVEVNPLIYENKTDINKTIFSAYRTILSFFGYTTIGTYPSNYTFPKP